MPVTDVMPMNASMEQTLRSDPDNHSLLKVEPRFSPTPLVVDLSRRDHSRSHCAFRCATAPVCATSPSNVSKAIASTRLQAYFFLARLAFFAVFFAFFAFFAMLPS